MILRKYALLFLVILMCNFRLYSQSKTVSTRSEYIESYKELAIKEMQRSGVPASITLAQGMLESDNGNSRLAREAKNHFGIKCHNDWKGPVIYHDDDRQGECFRKYKSVLESYQDHSDFLMSGSRYKFLFEYDPTDYKSWAKGLKKAGYATNPSYAEKLIKIIEENDLHQYDIAGKTRIGKAKALKKSIPSSSGNTSTREILVKNRVKYIIVKPEDNFRSIQEELGLLPFEIYKYNDMARDAELVEGQIIYIQPKRKRAEVGNNWHTVKEGETIIQISQIYAVKPEALLSINLMNPDTILKAGDKISLRKKIDGKKPVTTKKNRIKLKLEEEEEDEEIRFEFDK